MLSPNDFSETYERPSGLSDLLAPPQKPAVSRPTITISSSLDKNIPTQQEAKAFSIRFESFLTRSTVSWQQDLLAGEPHHDPNSNFGSKIIYMSTVKRLHDVMTGIKEEMPWSSKVLFYHSIANNRNMPEYLDEARTFIVDNLHSSSLNVARSLDALQSVYVAESWGDILLYLAEHPGLIELLLKAQSRISELFGSASQVNLKLVPEYDSEIRHTLFADVHTQDDPMVAFKKMNRFDEEWWLDASENFGGLLHFSVEFA